MMLSCYHTKYKYYGKCKEGSETLLLALNVDTCSKHYKSKAVSTCLTNQK